MEGTDKPYCSVVIRAYNEGRHIGRLLAGLAQQTIRRSVEVILVDSGPTDDTLAVAARYPVRVVRIRPEEFTFGRSLNLGIREARGELIAIASAHVYPVYPDWLERLLAPFEDPQVALTYGKQRGNSSTHFSEHQVFARWFPDQSQPRQAHPFCNNANAAIRRAVWEAHPYDEALSGLEDVAWARWALEQGYHIAYVAEAEVIHVHAEAPRQVFNRYRREAMAFKRIFPEARFHIWDFARLYTTNVLSDLWHAARRGVIRANWRSILWFRFMQFWGTYQGYRLTGPLTAQLRQTFYYPPGLRAAAEGPPRAVEPIRYNESGE